MFVASRRARAFLEIFMSRDPRWALSMNENETPQVAIFWLVQATDGDARQLTSGCPIDQTEPHGDCLTYGPGHYETWAHWRRDETFDPALRAIVRSYEYEDWPRGPTGCAISSFYMPIVSS